MEEKYFFQEENEQPNTQLTPYSYFLPSRGKASEITPVR